MSELYIIAHNIRSRHNVGSVFRTADSFAVTKLFLTGYTPAPPHPEIAKVALGAENFVPWTKVRSATSAIKKLKLEHPGLRVVALENRVKSKTTTLPKYHPKFPLVLILGEEVGGIPKPLLKQCDQLLEIPMLGKKESLNVSVACGIALYALRYPEA